MIPGVGLEHTAQGMYMLQIHSSSCTSDEPTKQSQQVPARY